MKLYMKEKVFSWGDKFTVWDEWGNDKYYVQGEVFTLGKKLHIYDLSGNEAAFIRQELFTLLPRFDVYCGNDHIAQIRKEFTLFYQKYTIDSLGWEVHGSFLAHDFEITHRGRTIVTITKEWMTWGDSYCLEIADQTNELVALAVVLAIVCIAEAASNNQP